MEKNPTQSLVNDNSKPESELSAKEGGNLLLPSDKNFFKPSSQMSFYNRKQFVTAVLTHDFSDSRLKFESPKHNRKTIRQVGYKTTPRKKKFKTK